MASSSQGSCTPDYAQLRAEFDQRLASDAELGASIAVIERGELVVDLWGGYAAAAKTKPWLENTLVNTWSITKTMTALAVLVLIDRNEIDPEAPVAKYWPEFAAAGKGGVLIKHLLSHSSGLAGWEQPIDVVDICDVQTSTARLAEQAPWWTPGSASGYHVLSYGHLLGEVIRRVTGQGLPQFFRTEIAEPLAADFHIALPITEHHRVSNIVPAALPPLPPPDTIGFKAFTGPLPVAEFVNSTTWRSAGIGAAGGHGNARAMAQIQSVIAHGGVANNRQILSADTVALATEAVVSGTDVVMNVPIEFGLGYGLAKNGAVPFAAARNIALWAGAGGSLVINDLERETTFAYVMNKMGEGMLGNDNSLAYYRLFDQLQSRKSSGV
jgi:CubicO group peptidase (beta-lactamase class C family)